jgi:3-phenylpropionate/trans-cinnamate dioxygenase ferredoxin reductase component
MVAPGFLAIGSGAAGVSAAETFRARHRHIPVRILSADPALPYAKPPLSKQYLCGDPADLDLHSAGWFDRNGIELILGVRVERIDIDSREVVTTGGARYPYWHLVLASGAQAVPLTVPGAEAALPLRSFADAVALKMAARHADSAVVIGAGLIGCEAATGLSGRGVETTLVAPESVPLARRFGVEVGERVMKMLTEAGVRFVGSAPVAAVDQGGVLLASGERVPGDLVVSATGVRPDVRLAVDAGLDVRDGRVVVDEHMRTSAPDVLAAGDITLAHNVTAGRAVAAEHWRDAAQQGRVAGLTAAGYPAAWDTISGFSCTVGAVTMRYRGWGGPWTSATVADRRNGFTATFLHAGARVGSLEATSTLTTSPAA